MSRRLLLLAALGLAALTATAAALGANKARVTEAAAQGFPARSYVLTLPHGMKLKAGSVQVLENGEAIDGLSVTPVGAGKPKQFAVVLAVDASLSMRGKPIAAAMAAARELAAQRQANQLLGVITFNKDVNVSLPLTDDPTAVDAALSKAPALNQGTRIYDAVDAAVSLLKEKRVEAGSIVLLSDGADVGSQLSEQLAAAHARDARVAVYTVGLRSRFFDRSALKQLARDVGGTFILANNVDSLTKIYRQLGSRFASQYLLRYRSLAGPNKLIKVTIKVDGLEGVATTQYRTPALAIATRGATPPYKPSAVNRILTSAALTTIVALIAAGLVGGAAATIIGGPRPGTVRERLAEFVSVPTAIRDRSRRPTAQLTDKMFEGTETMLRGSSHWQKFKWELQIAKVTMPPEQIAVLTAIGTLLALLLINYVLGSLLVAIVIAAAIPLGVRSLLKRQLAKQRKLFSEQLPDNLQVLASALRAGHSFIGALSVVVNDAPEPARSEFQRVVADEQLGVPIDQALHVVSERMESRELEQVALVAALQRETGGNTAEVLDRVTDTIRERFELRRTVQTLTAQGRMSRWVLTALPLVLLLVITVISPGYMDIMYHTSAGKVLMVLGAISVTAGSLVIKRIVNIKV
jgi:tight adherence protein B